MTDTAVITGADGYLGLKLCLSLLENTEQNLVLWMRADSESEVKSKTSAVTSLIPAKHTDRVQLTFGNLAFDNCFSQIKDLEAISHVIHTAAVIKFNVEADIADQINIAGSKRLFDLCLQLPNLKQLNYISTIYSSGTVEGQITEAPFENVAKFVNHYERSKNEAELLLLNEYGHLPWNVLRVATAIADDHTGKVSQYNAVHNTLRLLYNGLVSLLPGKLDTPLYFVTGDFAAESTRRVVDSSATNQFYHISTNARESLTLNQLLDQVYNIFSEDEQFVSKRILRPLMVEEAEFAALADNLEKMSSGIVGDAMSSIAPFAGQLYNNKQVANDNLQELWGTSYTAPTNSKLVDTTVRYLVKSKWGREGDL